MNRHFFSNLKMLPVITVPSVAKHTATVIFLHGLGDSGAGWSDVGKMFNRTHPHIKWIFPHAPAIKITVNGGMKMPGWYDIVSLDRIEAKQDKLGLSNSRDQINELLEHEISLGIPSSKIVLGGFSQGAAMSLLTGLSCQWKLGGIVALSGYLPLGDEIDTHR
jgi:predicted esterase